MGSVVEVLIATGGQRFWVWFLFLGKLLGGIRLFQHGVIKQLSGAESWNALMSRVSPKQMT